MHSDPVYLSTQLYIYTSPCVLTNIKAYMQVLCLKDLSKKADLFMVHWWKTKKYELNFGKILTSVL